MKIRLPILKYKNSEFGFYQLWAARSPFLSE